MKAPGIGSTTSSVIRKEAVAPNIISQVAKDQTHSRGISTAGSDVSPHSDKKGIILPDSRFQRSFSNELILGGELNINSDINMDTTVSNRQVMHVEGDGIVGSYREDRAFESGKKDRKLEVVLPNTHECSADSKGIGEGSNVALQNNVKSKCQTNGQYKYLHCELKVTH